jgi:hypothetical protein
MAYEPVDRVITIYLKPSGRTWKKEVVPSRAVAYQGDTIVWDVQGNCDGEVSVGAFRKKLKTGTHRAIAPSRLFEKQVRLRPTARRHRVRTDVKVKAQEAVYTYDVFVDGKKITDPEIEVKVRPS